VQSLYSSLVRLTGFSSVGWPAMHAPPELQVEYFIVRSASHTSLLPKHRGRQFRLYITVVASGEWSREDLEIFC
jgi:hypothetical protein